MPTCTEITGDPFLCIIDDLLTKEECDGLITRSHSIQTDDAGNKCWHRPQSGGSYIRVIMVDRELADRLYDRIRPFLPAEMNGHRLSYLNSHFRFSRYDKGGSFPIHMDGTNFDNDRSVDEYCAVSVCTLNIFLNDDFEGGATEFFVQTDASSTDLKSRYVAAPKAGRAALFYAKQFHCGQEVLSPYKYLLRTDVMGV